MTDDALLTNANVWVRDVHPHTEHLLQTHAWLLKLDPEARPALKLAALLHDIERAYPDPDSPFVPANHWSHAPYIDYHQGRCARLLSGWLVERGAELPFMADAVSLVAVHELGGWPDANLLQAADSLSFIETMGPLIRQWIERGETTREHALAKLRHSFDRMQVPRAFELGDAMYREVFDACRRAEPGS